MSFILIPNSGESVHINSWNWRPTLEFLYKKGLIDKENFELLGAQGCGGKVDADSARRIAEVVDSKVNTMKPGDRLRIDGAVTGEPKKKVEFHSKAEIDAIDLYSATYEWLVMFRDFCRICGGFKVS